MKISAKITSLAIALISLVAIIIKFYFIPVTDNFLEISLREQMKRDMQSFEQVLHTVVSAAGDNKDFVRRALYSISANPAIPIELRRSKFIEDQYGKKEGHGARNDLERAVFKKGKPEFRKTTENFEYIYPIRATGVCQRCHADAQGKVIPHGYIIGLAVRTTPVKVLRDSSLSYFVMDFFWENLLLVGMVIGILLAGVFFWVILPLRKISRTYAPRLLEEESDYEGHHGDELEVIQRGLERRFEDK